MFRLIGSALVAVAVFALSFGVADQFSDRAFAEATTTTPTTTPGTTPSNTPASKADPGDKSKAAKKKKRDLTQGQKSARERQRQCGREWREAKKANKVDKGMTWPKYWSACNARLKSKST